MGPGDGESSGKTNLVELTVLEAFQPELFQAEYDRVGLMQSARAKIKYAGWREYACQPPYFDIYPGNTFR